MHTQSFLTCKPRDRHVPTKKCISFTVIERNCAQRDLCLLFGSYFTDCCTIISRDKVPWSPLEGAARLSVSLTQRGCTLSCAVSRIYLCATNILPSAPPAVNAWQTLHPVFLKSGRWLNRTALNVTNAVVPLADKPLTRLKHLAFKK